MKQLFFMAVLTLTGTVGTVFISPMLGVSVYYILAILRPQYLWEWALPQGVAWSYYVALATIAASLAAWFGGHRPVARGPWPNWAHTFIFLFGAWVGVTYLTAYNPEATVSWAIEGAKIFVMLFASMVLIRTVRHVWILYACVALSLSYIAYEFNLTYLTTGLVRIQRDGFGGYDNNIVGLMLGMAIPMCYFAWEGTTSRYRWGFLLLVPVLLHAVLMSYSRGAMVSLLVVAPLVGLRSRHRGAFAALGLVFVLMVPVMAGESIRERFFTIAQHETDNSANLRRESWAAGLAIARDHPILGVGIRNANLLSHQYGADMEGRTIHSQYIQIAADNGFVGLGLYLAALASVWLSLNRARRAGMRHPGPAGARVQAMAAGLECALAIFCFGSIFLSLDILEMPYLLLLLGAQLEPLTCAAPGRAVATKVRRIAPAGAA